MSLEQDRARLENHLLEVQAVMSRLQLSIESRAGFDQQRIFGKLLVALIVGERILETARRCRRRVLARTRRRACHARMSSRAGSGILNATSGAMLFDPLEPPGQCSGCWPHDGEVDGCAVEIFVLVNLVAGTMELGAVGRPMMMMSAGAGAARPTGHRQRSPKFCSTDMGSSWPSASSRVGQLGRRVLCVCG